MLRHLFQAEDQPGFTNALLNILQAEQDNSIRLSSTHSGYPCLNTANSYTAVVYLKNRVTRAWQPGEGPAAHKQIPENEKLDLRNRLLPILASSSPQVRIQLIPILQKILSYDFPTKWPNFLDMTMQLLNMNDANSVFAGLHCMLAICRMYRFKGGESRGNFNQIVEASFPQLLGIATRLVEETSLEAWEMLHIIMKAYKHAIYVGRTSIRLRPRANVHEV